ncbi:MAG TPA: S9 family peptidase [Stellaceae bacterium]|jgi:dipeptidyl aminopeptidase/acylaminoacyl peptidase|nr:S9 family peptidase [Stellaceae bacterium]
MTEILPYGAWRSPVTSDLIVGEAIGLGDILVDGAGIYWIESRPGEAGRNVIVRHRPSGSAEDVTPRPFSARSRVHEYGGGSAVVRDGIVYFTSFADQRLYRQAAGAAPVPLTPAGDHEHPGTRHRYADGVLDTRRRRWIGVREEHAADGVVNNTLVALDLEASGPQPGRILAHGHDFYASAKLSPDGLRLAWLTWDHPNMPWVGTELWLAEIAADGTLATPRLVAGADAESVFQPQWSPDGVLYFVSDRTGWWNLYRCDPEAGGIRPLCPRDAEFGQAQWVFGQSTYAFLSPEHLVCTYDDDGRGVLARLDMASGGLAPLDLPYTSFGGIRVAGGRILCRAASPTEPTAIIAIDAASGAVEILRQSAPAASVEGLRRYFSVPRHIAFPTEQGLTAHAHYYPPANPDFAPPPGEKPPLVVKCHGGPTASASTTLSLGIQYWTSRGIAVLDVDYGGSTGYGRAYRERLKGMWGVVDVDDCVNATRHVVTQGLADGERAVITGGSAGGYTVLAALAGRDVFRGGASYYGVSDVAALARDTHKFESRYLDWLIGPYPERADLYRERSPLTYADGLRCPVIFFQGADDRVVPPNQTEMMVDVLRRRGIPVGYLLFAGEQHGFRRAENIKRCLDSELAFYAALVFNTRLSF